MMGRGAILSLVLLSVFLLVRCDVEGVKLGSFEGTYTSKFGFGLYICEDGDSIQGAYDQVGVLSGELSTDKKQAKGRFYEAGFSACSRGDFDIKITSDGFEGTITCKGSKNHTTHRWAETKLSVFRPSNNFCALRYTKDDLSLEGRWTDAARLNMDACFIDNDVDDDENTLISLRRVGPNGNPVDWYVVGDWTDEGRLMQGTWYQNFTAGAFLLYLRETGEAEYLWWTGLLSTGGSTYIDSNQYYDITRHGVGRYFGPRQSIVGSDCVRNEWLKPFVKKNVPKDDDDDFYYFVQTKFLDSDKFLYHKEPQVLVAGANHVYISFILSVICFLVALF